MIIFDGEVASQMTEKMSKIQSWAEKTGPYDLWFVKLSDVLTSNKWKYDDSEVYEVISVQDLSDSLNFFRL